MLGLSNILQKVSSTNAILEIANNYEIIFLSKYKKLYY